MSKTNLFSRIDDTKEVMGRLSQQIWETPELGLNEEESATSLMAVLDEEGFSLTSGIGEMPTAFVASYGDTGPEIGILGEFDALPGLSQQVTTNREPIEGGAPGHGCGHNLIGTAGIGAAVGIKHAIESDELDGSIHYYGCPAEEILVGKTYMARSGSFNNLDAAVTWHPSDLTKPYYRPTNALNSLIFDFEGTSAHAAGAPESGRSALDAVELLNTGVEYMREHISDEARIHYVITDGGAAPNVVPATASVWYFVRSPDRNLVETNTEWLRDIASAASQMTQTDVTERFLTGCHDYKPNNTITDTLWENMQTVDAIEYDDGEQEFAREIQQTVTKEQLRHRLETLPKAIRNEAASKALYSKPLTSFDTGKRDYGSTDVGDVSHITPTGQFRVASWPVGTPAHSWQAVAANGSFAQSSMEYAAKVLGGTIYDLMDTPAVIGEAREEFESGRHETGYVSPLSDGTKPPFDLDILNR